MFGFLFLIYLNPTLWAFQGSPFVLQKALSPNLAGSFTRVKMRESFPSSALGLAKYYPYKEYLPKSKGVYTIFDSSGIVQYVGSSNDIDNRLQDHMRSGLLQKNFMVEAVTFHDDTKQQEIFNYERKRIKELNPPKNKHSGTPGGIWLSERKDNLKNFYMFHKESLIISSRETLRKFLADEKLSSKERKVCLAFLRVARHFK